MSELDSLKNNINTLGGLCQGMIKAGNLGMTYSTTTESCVKDSLDIIARLEEAKKAIPPPPKVEEPVEPPKESEPSTKVPSPKKRKNVRKYG